MTLKRIAAALLFALLSLHAAADEVRLANGDRISGEVKSLVGGKLVVATRYAGTLEIAWSEVASIATTHPVEIVLSRRERPVLGTLESGSAGHALLLDEHGAANEIELNQVSGLKPALFAGPRTAYSGRALLSAAYARGNAESNQLHLYGELNARARLHRYSISAKVDRLFEPQAGTRTAWLTGGNFDRFLDERRFAYLRGSVEHDLARDIDRRTALGAGYGLQLLDSPAASLSVRAGLDYVSARRTLAPDQNYPALGWGVKASYSPWGPRLQLFHEHEGFWNLHSSSSVVVRSKSGLRVPIFEGLNATAELDVDWERTPAPGRASTDSLLLFGVDYAF